MYPQKERMKKMDNGKMGCNNNCNLCQPPCPPAPPMPPLPPFPNQPCPPPPPENCGCSNKTQFYQLPLWKPSDVTSWLMQMNGAMIRIDSILHNLALRTGINGLPDDLTNAVSQLTQDVAVLQNTVCDLGNNQATLKLQMTNMSTQLGAIQTDISSLQLSVTNLDTRIMTIDSSNKQNQNNITLIKSDLNMLSSTVQSLQSNVSQYQEATNTTLTNLQNQINDIAEIVVPSTENTDVAVSDVTVTYVLESDKNTEIPLTMTGTPTVFKQWQVNFTQNSALALVTMLGPINFNYVTNMRRVRIVMENKFASKFNELSFNTVIRCGIPGQDTYAHTYISQVNNNIQIDIYLGGQPNAVVGSLFQIGEFTLFGYIINGINTLEDIYPIGGSEE